MLASLFGNRNLERILLFLFVNEKCYATQIASLLTVPLFPVQNGLSRLEKGGIVVSRLEGKSKIYRFNGDYPLKTELEALLKKSYTLLPPQEKKKYCFLHNRDRRAKQDLTAFWKQLQSVKSLSFSAKLRRDNELEIKMGQGIVATANPASNHLLFHEKGHWYSGQIAETAFSNTLRWTLDQAANLITLEHLRYGIQSPVFLFHLAPTTPFHLESVDAHLCGSDTYLGSLHWNKEGIDFHWRIIGPVKNDELLYRYGY